MSAILDFIGDVFEAAVEVVEKVADAVVSTVKAAVKDPITTLAKVAAYATGNVWAIPLIDGASTLAKGGDIGDAIKSAAISYGTQQIQIKVGTPVGNAAGQFAASQGAEVATQKLVANIVTRAAGNAGVALITKQDPVKAFVAGGVSAASSAVLGQIPNFDKQPAWVQNTVATSVGALVAGQQNFDEAAASVLVATSGIVSNALKLYDPDGSKMTASQRSVAADAIFKTTSAALAGRSPTEALTQSLTNAAAGALGEFARDNIRIAADGMADAYAKINDYGQQLDSIVSGSQSLANQFNDVNGSLTAAINEQNRLYAAQEAARNAYNSSGSDADYNAANAAVSAYNDYVSALNKSYTEYYKPTLDSLAGQIQQYQSDYDRLSGAATSEQGALKGKIDSLTANLDPVYASSNRAFAEGLLPGFDEEAYRELNPSLPEDVDPFLHYITTGQYEGFKGTKDQLTQSNAIIDAILSNPNVDERALQEYINSGYLTKDYVESKTQKSYDDLLSELDIRVTTEDEAKQFFKDIYGRDAESDADAATVQRFTNLAEEDAKLSLQGARIEDEYGLSLNKDQITSLLQRGNIDQTASDLAHYLQGDSDEIRSAALDALAADPQAALNIAKYDNFTPQDFGAAEGETWQSESAPVYEQIFTEAQAAKGKFKEATGDELSKDQFLGLAKSGDIANISDRLIQYLEGDTDATRQAALSALATDPRAAIEAARFDGYTPQDFGAPENETWETYSQKIYDQSQQGWYRKGWESSAEDTRTFTRPDGTRLVMDAQGNVLEVYQPTENQWRGPVGPMDAETGKRFDEEYARYLEYLAAGQPAPPTYGTQDLNVSQDYWDSFNDNLLRMQEEGRLPTQWRPNEDGTFTYQADDGSSITIGENGEILGVKEAPVDKPTQNAPAPQGPDPQVPVRPPTTGVRPPTRPPVRPSMPDLFAQSVDQQMMQMPAALQSLQQVTKPIYGGEVQDFDLSSPLDVNFFDVRKETQDGQKQQQATKIAAGGYIDNLLAGDMTADDLLNLLR